jgi:hypothetical protein
MSATGRMWRHNWRLDFSVGRFALQAESRSTLNDSFVIRLVSLNAGRIGSSRRISVAVCRTR